ncbi:MAG: class I SAM-dependent methyltransferase [Solirubrobacteraceae bacterium]|nr:class I SAM-dependent methyltransferase [Solirubrobacteraceae bacterium]
MREPSQASAAYLEVIRRELPEYDRLQDEVVHATDGLAVARILDLGTGTGETSRRLLLAHPEASVIAIDPDAELLQIARDQLGDHADFRLGDLYEPLPHGPFDLIVSALSVHTMRPIDRSQFFSRAHRALRSGGRLVIGDAVTPGIELPGSPPLQDRAPDRLETLVERISQAGFTPKTTWSGADLAVVVGQK